MEKLFRKRFAKSRGTTKDVNPKRRTSGSSNTGNEPLRILRSSSEPYPPDYRPSTAPTASRSVNGFPSPVFQKPAASPLSPRTHDPNASPRSSKGSVRRDHRPTPSTSSLSSTRSRERTDESKNWPYKWAPPADGADATANFASPRRSSTTLAVFESGKNDTDGGNRLPTPPDSSNGIPHTAAVKSNEAPEVGRTPSRLRSQPKSKTWQTDRIKTPDSIHPLRKTASSAALLPPPRPPPDRPIPPTPTPSAPLRRAETEQLTPTSRTYETTVHSAPSRQETEPLYAYRENEAGGKIVNSSSDDALYRYAQQESVDAADLKKFSERQQQVPDTGEASSYYTDHPASTSPQRSETFASTTSKTSKKSSLLSRTLSDSDSEDDAEPLDESLAKFYRGRAVESLTKARFDEADQAISRLERSHAIKPGVDGWGATIYRKKINEAIEYGKLDLAELLTDHFMARYPDNADVSGFHKKMASKNEDKGKFNQAARSLEKAADSAGAWINSASYVKQYKRVSRLNLLNALLARPKDLELAEKHLNKLLALLDKVNNGKEWKGKEKDFAERKNLLVIKGCIRFLQKMPQTAIDELSDAISTSSSDSKGLLVANLKYKSMDYLARAYFELKQIDSAAKYCRRAVTGYRSVDKFSKSSSAAVSFMIKIQEARGDSLEADGYRSMLRPEDDDDVSCGDLTPAKKKARSLATFQKLVLGPEWTKAKSLLEKYNLPPALLQHYTNRVDTPQYKGGPGTLLLKAQVIEAAQNVVADSVRLGLNDLLWAMLELQFVPNSIIKPGTNSFTKYPLSNFDFMDAWRPPKSKKSFVGRFRPKTMKVTPLSLATDKDNLAAVKILVNGMADVNMASGGGNTALHIAVKNGRLDVIKLLLDAGADVSVANQRGKTALDLARHADVTRLLRPRMYLLGKESLGTQSVLDFAAECL